MSNELTGEVVAEREAIVPMQYTGAFASATSFENAQRMAIALCSSTLVPKEYQGKDNLGNAIIALEMAMRIGASPLMIMQNLYIVHGRPGWSSQFIIAAINGSGRFEPLDFVMSGTPGLDNFGCHIETVVKRTGKKITGPLVTVAMAKAEEWFQKSGSKWQTMPEIMLGYRAASFFGKRYAPDILMGMQTAEELQDMPTALDITPVVREAETHTDDLNAALASARKPVQAEAPAKETPAEEPSTEKEAFGLALILAQFEKAETFDKLDAVADLMRDLKPADKKKAQAAYQERRHILDAQCNTCE